MMLRRLLLFISTLMLASAYGQPNVYDLNEVIGNRIERINKEIFNSKYALVHKACHVYNFNAEHNVCRDFALDTETINFKSDYFNLSDEVKIVYWGDNDNVFYEFDEKGKLVRYSKVKNGKIDTVATRYAETNKFIFYNDGSNPRDYIYNKRGYLVEHRDTINEYDTLGRLIKHEGGFYKEYKYSDNDEVEIRYYQDKSKSNLMQYLHFDHFGFIDSMLVYKTGKAATINVKYTTYDSGKIESRTEVKDGKEFRKYMFDEEGRIISYIEFDKPDEAQTWSYFKSGRLKEHRISKYDVVKYSYRPNGILDVIQEYVANGRLSREVFHDKYGNRTKEIKYDKQGRATENILARYIYF